MRTPPVHPALILISASSRARRLTTAVAWLLLTIVVIGSAGSPLAQEPRPHFTISVGEPALLEVWNRPVVEFRAVIGAGTPERRVAAAITRIEHLSPSDLAAGAIARPGTVGPISGYLITVNDGILFGLVDEDVDPERGLTLEAVAKQAAEELSAALSARLEQRSIPDLLEAIAVTAAMTAALVAVFLVVLRLRHRSIAALSAAARARSIKLRGIDLAPYLRAVEAGLVRMTAFAVNVLALYIWLTVVLLQFPYTRPWGERLDSWFGDLLFRLAMSAVSSLPGLFTVVVIFLATRLIVQIVHRFFLSVEDASLRIDWLSTDTARATRRIVVGFIWVFAVTVAFPYIPGSDSDAFRGIGVLLGLMVSIGSAGFVNQVMSGLVLVYSRSLRPGEFVAIGDDSGTVSEVGFLSTKVVTPMGREITIPNAVVTSSKVVNHSRLATPDTGAYVDVGVTIGYDAPWRQVHAMLEEAARRTSLARRTPVPVVLHGALGDFYVEYRLFFSIDRPDRRYHALSEAMGHIQDVFNENGVQIMSPHFVDQPDRKVFVKKEDWYAPPAKPPTSS